jgi:mannose-6-phosphate isomerase-like protein (cupin superfamily)
MKTTIKKFPEIAELVKSNERYNLYDFKLEHLVVSMTVLNPEQETRGHSHDNVDEIYICTSGSGKIQVGEEEFDFKEEDIVTIPSGAFHKVVNPTTEKLIFLSIFEKYERK